MATKVEIRMQGSGGAEAMLDGTAISIVFLGLSLAVAWRCQMLVVGRGAR